MKSKKYCYTKRSISDDAGIPYRKVLRDIRMGIVDPGRFLSVCCYVMGYRLLVAPDSRYDRPFKE